jgi:hypothetical protein
MTNGEKSNEGAESRMRKCGECQSNGRSGQQERVSLRWHLRFSHCSVQWLASMDNGATWWKGWQGRREIEETVQRRRAGAGEKDLKRGNSSWQSLLFLSSFAER